MVEAVKLKRRRRRAALGRTLAEGPLVVEEAIAAGAPIHALFVVEGEGPGAPGVQPIVVTPSVMGRLAGTESPRGPVAVVSVPVADLGSDDDVVVLWGVGDPGNVGTLARSAAAFGVAVAVGPGAADPWSPKALRAGAGAQFRATVAIITSLADLGGRHIVATVASGGIGPADVDPPRPWALLIGDEAHGLPDEVLAAADVAVTVPMPGGTDSLNAAVAGSIILQRLVERR